MQHSHNKKEAFAASFFIVNHLALLAIECCKCLNHVVLVNH